jgi:very-short-patch-repair endonuclease
MGQPWRSSVDSRRSISTARLGEVAARQWGVLSLQQVRQLGFSESAVRRLVARGYLVRLYPGVYAVGHEPLRIEGRLLAALFHAGPGSALSHTTAAYWWRLIEATPAVIHIATPNRPGGADDLKIHRPRQVEAVRERRLMVTPVHRTLIDIAAMLDTKTLRRALAEADHQNRLNPPSLIAQIRPGQPGGQGIRKALARHLPELASAESELERRFLELVQRASLPTPEVQVWIQGFRVDALWRAHKLVIELDGHATHANAAANETDRRRELTLRAAGYTVVRYTWEQVTQRPAEVVADLVTLLGSLPLASVDI